MRAIEMDVSSCVRPRAAASGPRACADRRARAQPRACGLPRAAGAARKNDRAASGGRRRPTCSTVQDAGGARCEVTKNAKNEIYEPSLLTLRAVAYAYNTTVTQFTDYTHSSHRLCQCLSQCLRVCHTHIFIDSHSHTTQGHTSSHSNA